MNITSKTDTIEKLFSGVDTRYIVPHYQRDYAWTVDNILELWADIINAWQGGSEYFMGTIVLNGEFEVETSALEIVDGQQRLATFTILIAVVRDICERYQVEPENEVFAKVDSLIAANKEKALRAQRKAENLILYVAEPDNYFIELNEKDQPKFHDEVQASGKLLFTKDERKIYKSDSRIIKAKKILTARIIEDFLPQADAFIRLDQFLTFCMTRLLFLRIDVKSDADAYLLFETLNDRGLDLSIADLVKNRLLISCGNDQSKKKRVLQKWDQIVAELRDSRYQAHDFLRFYWSAFHGNVTKKEIYNKIKKHLVEQADPEALVDSIQNSAEFFGDITGKGLRYPAGSSAYGPDSIEQGYAEINALGYSVCYPFLMSANQSRPEVIPQLLPAMIAFLFRLVSIGGFAAGRAEQAFQNALRKLNTEASVDEMLLCFQDDEISDDRFKERIITGVFEDNKLARYFLAKIHDYQLGTAFRLTTDVHLEHILPVKSEKWTDFDAGGRAIDDWIFSVGNMTLLEKGLNQRLQNDVFGNKIGRYKKREDHEDADMATSIPLTYRIHEAYAEGRKTWTKEWILERATHFAELAPQVWPLIAINDVQI